MNRLDTLAIWVTAVGLPLSVHTPVAGIVALVLGAILAECGRIASWLNRPAGDKS